MKVKLIDLGSLRWAGRLRSLELEDLPYLILLSPPRLDRPEYVSKKSKVMDDVVMNTEFPFI